MRTQTPVTVATAAKLAMLTKSTSATTAKRENFRTPAPDEGTTTGAPLSAWATRLSTLRPGLSKL